VLSLLRLENSADPLSGGVEMVWKPKEKELSKEEAIALAKKELLPFWLGISPLFAVTRPAPAQPVQLFPLHASFTEKNWFILICDPLSPEGAMAQNYFKEWNHRYSENGIHFLLIRSEFVKASVGKSGVTFDTYRRYSETFPVMVDHSGDARELFKLQSIPQFRMFSQGKVQFQRLDRLKEVKDFQEVELEIQNFLRTKDPGLPLFRPYTPEVHLMYTVAEHNFGKHEKKGFFHFEGKFRQTDRDVEMGENGASISFEVQGSCLSLIASSSSRSSLNPRIIIEVDGRPVFDSYAGSSIQFEETGHSYILVEDLTLYSIYQGLKPGKHSVKFIFPNALTAPIRLFRIIEADYVAPKRGSA
jgi:hypothetical protein